MIYATATQLITRYGANEIAQRADRGDVRLVTAQIMTDAAAGANMSGYTADEQAAAAAALTVVQRCLDDARDTIDSNIGGRYSLPIMPVPDILQRIACELARYYLYDDQVSEAIQARYDNSMKLLFAVRDGKAQLGPQGSSGEEPASNDGADLVNGSDRVWKRESSKGFM